jgi:hypothetical protein
MEILMTAGVIARVNELGSGKPELLTWTNRRGEAIGDGPTWDTAGANTNNDVGDTSEVAGATEDDDDNEDNVNVVAEEDRRDNFTTEVDVVDDIAGVDDRRMDAPETYEVWNDEVPEYGVGDEHRINDDVKVTYKSTSGGVQTKSWD